MRSLFKYSLQEKRGLTFLLFLIALLQSGIFWFEFQSGRSTTSLVAPDSLAIAFSDSVRTAGVRMELFTPHPFNPNFISDYKGYLQGMTPQELDRLHAFRAEGRYVRDATEFGQVTGVSDSLLSEISPYFLFPVFQNSPQKKKPISSASVTVKDLNTVTAADLQAISGIGPVLSDRIVRFRDRLGGFLVKEQLYDVYGLDSVVAERAMAAFSLRQVPDVQKINVNTAGVDELSGLVYISRRLARAVVSYRETHGSFDSIEQLTKIEDFPNERIGRIKLYLGL